MPDSPLSQSATSAERFLEVLRAVAQDCGYAVGVHGSQKRDLDLIAAPWKPETVSAQQLVDTICDVMGLHPRKINFYGDELPPRMEPNPEMKPWGRLAWALDGVPGSTGWKYVDLSVAPRAGEAVPASIAQGYRTAERECLQRQQNQTVAFCALERAALEVSKELGTAEGQVPLGVGTSIIAMRRVLGV